jgi:general secretion pathway protein I
MKTSNGFTLLETLLALMIISSALLLLTNSWSGSYAKLRKTQESFEITALLERKMGELEREWKGKAIESIPESIEDTFGDKYPEYSWKMTSRNVEFPDLSQSLVSREGGADQITLSSIKQLTEAIKTMVKEITLTVIYQKNGRKREISVSTYFVDFNKPFTPQLPAGVF